VTDLTPELCAWLRATLHTDAPITADPLAARSNNRSFRLVVGKETYALKLIHPRRAASIAHELAILPYLHARGVPVPEVLAIGCNLPGIPETAILRSYLSGVPASEREHALPPRARTDLLTAMGALLARIHTLPLADVAPFWQFPEDTVHAPVDWATNFVQKKVASDLAVLLPSGALGNDIYQEMCETLPHWAEVLAAMPITLAPLHGDFYLDNLLIDDAGTICGLLDWEAARLGDPLWELARTQMASFAETPADWDVFLAAYRRGVLWPVDTGRIACYGLLMAMGDLRYAVRHAPDLIPARAAHLGGRWRRLMEESVWS
jgi:aminoglycoside phosphotransferase (APT) family kinase protein